MPREALACAFLNWYYYFKMSPSRCPRHHLPRPCPECAAAGHGGPGRGQGRKALFREPERVTVLLERVELEAVLGLFPGESKSGALRRALLELPAVGLASEVAELEREAEAEAPAIPRGARSAEVRLTYAEWRVVDQVLRAGQSRLGRAELVPGRKEKLAAWHAGLGIPEAAPDGASPDDVAAATLSAEDCRRIRSALGHWIEERRGAGRQEVSFRTRYIGNPRELGDPRLRERHRLEYRRDTLRVQAALAKVPRPVDSVF